MPPKFKNSTAADFAAAKTPKKRKTAPKPKGKEAKVKGKKAKVKDVPFPFLDLPPELRVMIYKLLLVESSVELSYTTGGQGKGFSRGRLTKEPGRGGRGGFNRWISFKPKRNDNQPTLLQPAILRVCKSIRTEATPYLYNQPMYFENPIALQRFLARVAPSTLDLLRKIVIRGWTERNIPCWIEALSLAFAMLTTAHNLESIHFDRRVSDSSDYGFFGARRSPWYVATRILMPHLSFWIRYVNGSGGKKAAELLSFSDVNFGSEDEIKNTPKVIEERKKMFFEEIKLD